MPPAAGTVTAFDRWVLRPLPRPHAAVTLLCVPYAGGGATAYHGWAELLPPFVEPWVLRLPGRESRLREAPYVDVAELARAAADALAPRLERTFAFYGHSLGALVAFELARALRDRHGTAPAHLAVGARCAPSRHVPMPALHALPDQEFLDVADRRFGAIPAVIRTDPEIRALVLPALRADMTMLETYVYRRESPLDCPLLAFAGHGDPEASTAQMREWAAEVTGTCSVHEVPGGHFFLKSEKHRVTELLVADLARLVVP
jgi:medium-chain acyl-[acyl-carrier-protein] hydrolase